MDNKHCQFHFGCSIFPVHFLVSYDNDKEACLKYFRKITKERLPKVEEYDFDSEAFCYDHDAFIMIRIKRDSEHTFSHLSKIVAHEAVHASYGVQSYVDQIFCEECQEPQAYLVEYIVGTILNKLFCYEMDVKEKHVDKHGKA